MNSALRSLERYLICQVGQVALRPIAVDYVERWERARRRREALPDVLDILSAAGAARVPTLAAAPLFHYIAKCRDKGAVPDPDYIVRAFLHGRAANDILAKTCRCPARELLNRPFPP